MKRSPRARKLEKLKEAGIAARQAGKPCDAPTSRELERAAWENGWRFEHEHLQKLQMEKEKRR